MIVITGGAGFIGSVLLWKLNESGEKDILIVDQKAENSPKWENIRKHAFAHYLESDEFITYLEAGKFDQKVTAIFHMGACSDTTEMDREYLKNNNTLYSERLAKWSLANNAYFSYASSAATYGDGKLGFADDDTLTPRLKPLNPYGQSKLDFDNWVLKNKLESKLVGFRFFNVYGPNEYHKDHMRSLVHKGFEQVTREGTLRLFKSYRKKYLDGGQKRDFVYVKDAVEAMLWFYKHPDAKGIFNLGQGQAESWNDLAKALFKACDKPINIEYIEMPDKLKNQYQYFTEANVSKLKLAGCPVHFRDLDKGVEDYVKHHLVKQDPYL